MALWRINRGPGNVFGEIKRAGAQHRKVSVQRSTQRLCIGHIQTHFRQVFGVGDLVQMLAGCINQGHTVITAAKQKVTDHLANLSAPHQGYLCHFSTSCSILKSGIVPNACVEMKV